MITEIQADGIIELNVPNETTAAGQVAIYRDADVTAATVEVGFIDTTGTFSAFVNGDLPSGGSAVIECGRGVRLAVQVTGFASPFNINLTS